MSEASEPFLLKELFNPESVGAIGDAVAGASPEFDRAGFMERVFDTSWAGRELKQRMRHVTNTLHGALPGAYREQLEVLVRAAPSVPEGLPALVLSDFVELYGTGDWEASMDALPVFTRRGSAEFAVRPFIAAEQGRTLARMREWAIDSDPLVRRLASEGCRPRLPWGMRLHALVKDPSPVISILQLLCNDPDEVVRRSVANNLNDISKDHPALALEVVEAWRPEPGTPLYALARHGLRTLLKRGDRRALEVLGFSSSPQVELAALELDPPAPSIGGSAYIDFTVRPTGSHPAPVTIDFAVHYVKADGSRSPKVFRLGSTVLEPGVPISYRRKLSFRQMTTRTHRPGLHKIDVLVSGNVAGSLEFQLGPAGSSP